MNTVRIFGVLLLASLVLSGCGETFGGIKKDTLRIGKGIKTIFVSGA